jgi:acyl-CoA dehydrogenase
MTAIADSSAEVAAAAGEILTATVGAASGWDVAAWTALEESGLTSILLTESMGGGGGRLVEAAEVVRAVGAHAAAVPIVDAALLAPWLLERAGLPVPTGPVVVADGRATIEAVDAGDGRWSLSGTAPRVPYARHAGTILVLVGGGVAPVDPADVTITTCDDAAGEPRDDVSFDGLVVAGATVDLTGFELFPALGRLLLCAGAAATVQDMVLQQVREREQFGRAIARFQAVQHLVAELAGEVTAVSIGADAAVRSLQDGPPDAAWLAVASAAIDGDASVTRIAAIAHQLHGAIGTTHEHALHRFTTRLWTWREEGGTSREWSAALADRLLAPERDELWVQVSG